MAFTLDSISKQARLRAPRIVLLGTEKIGKTTFACGSRFEGGKLVEIGLNKPIVIPIRGEEGADALAVPTFPTCHGVTEVLEAVALLYTEDHEYKTVVIDSASALQPLVEEEVCQEAGVDNIRKVPGFRTGDAACVNKWRAITNGLDALRDSKGMASIIIGHSKVRTVKNPEGENWDAFDFDLDMPEVGELLKRWADAIFFAGTKTIVKMTGEDTKFSKAKRQGKDNTGGQRFLFTGKHPARPTGGRGVYGQLPDELPLDWAAFEEAVAAVASA